MCAWNQQRRTVPMERWKYRFWDSPTTYHIWFEPRDTPLTLHGKHRWCTLHKKVHFNNISHIQLFFYLFKRLVRKLYCEERENISEKDQAQNNVMFGSCCHWRCSFFHSIVLYWLIFDHWHSLITCDCATERIVSTKIDQQYSWYYLFLFGL